MTCPFIDAGYACCSHHLNMRRLNEAFAYCHNRYVVCSVYIQLARPASPQTLNNAPSLLQTTCHQP